MSGFSDTMVRVVKLNKEIYDIGLIKKAIAIMKVKAEIKKVKNYYKVSFKGRANVNFFLATMIYLISTKLAISINENKIKSLLAYSFLNAFRKNEKNGN